MAKGLLYKISIFLFPVISVAQIVNGPIAKFSFNNADAKDEVSNNLAKVYGASLIEDRFGNEKSAYFLHGNQNSYLNLGTGKNLKPEKGSISVWIKIEHAMESGKGFESNPILFTRAHAEERHCEAYFIGYDYKTKNLNVNTTYSKLDQISVYSTNPTSLRRWHHVVMTYDDDFLSFYLDGVLETKMPKNFKSRFLENDSVIVGNFNAKENVRFFNGCIDDIEYYNHVLSGSDVIKLYNAPNPKQKTILKDGKIESGLVAKYTFNDGDARDEKGKNNAKAVGVSLAKDRFGNNRSAYYLQGNAGSYLNLGTSNVLKPASGSISLWFNVDNTVKSGEGAENNPIILTKSHEGDDFYEGYYLGYDFNGKKISVATTLSEKHQISLRSSDTLVHHKWYHVVITYDDKFLSVYIDGLLENRLEKNFRSRFLYTDSVMIGNSANSINYRFFNGYIDDILIYDRVLTAKEVAELYNAPNPKAYKEILKWGIVILSALIIVILLIIFIVKRTYRLKLEKQKELNALNARLNDLETKSIRTQMNPHFIFNSLNTLQRFILEEDTTSAHTYLTKFSGLLRKMMESSTSDAILLSEEIDILKNYIEVEKLRFANSFEYEIDNRIKDSKHVKIPFMMIQPFVENAIWHGLMPKSEQRNLKIQFTDIDTNRILCVVDDNGVGRNYKNKENNPLKKKSLAIEFISQRLDLLHKSTGIECRLLLIDKKDDSNNSMGTTVEITIPKIN